MDPQPPQAPAQAPAAANPGYQIDYAQDLASPIEILGSVEAQKDRHVASIYSADCPDELTQHVNADPNLKQLGFLMRLKAHRGSLMIRIVDYDGSQIHVMNASALLVEVSRRFPAARFVLQLDNRLFQVDSGYAISESKLPRPWLRVPHVDKMTVLKVAGQGLSMKVEGRYLGGGEGFMDEDFMEKEELVLYLILPNNCRAKRFPLRSAYLEGTSASFLIPPDVLKAIEEVSAVTLRLRRGSACAADCVAKTTMFLPQTASPQQPAEPPTKEQSVEQLQLAVGTAWQSIASLESSWQPGLQPKAWKAADSLEVSGSASRASLGAARRQSKDSSSPQVQWASIKKDAAVLAHQAKAVGYESNGCRLYSIRVPYEGSMLLGKTSPDLAHPYVVIDGKEVSLSGTPYEVLVNPDDFKWRPMLVGPSGSSIPIIPPGAIPAGFENANFDDFTFIARWTSNTRGGRKVVPGKAGEHLGRFKSQFGHGFDAFAPQPSEVDVLCSN